MRLIHKIRSLTTAGVLFGSGLLMATSALALTIDTPTEGRLVRDKVPIVIPRYSLPPEVIRSGFITIKIDGRFLAAVDASLKQTDSKAPFNPNVVYIWDTKRPINDPTLPTDQRHYRDGRHVILVEAFAIGSAMTSKDNVLESATVTVTLQNQVQRPNPAPPVNMKYRYHLGLESRFKVGTTCEILDATGYSLTGGQFPVVGEYDVLQIVEDMETSSSALLRYKVDKDSAFTQIFGQISLLGQMQKYSSVYKIIDVRGKVIDPSVMSGRNKIEVTDCLLPLPNYAVQVGDRWPVDMRLKLEGLTDYGRYRGTSALAGFEWDSGFECAKIISEIRGSSTFYFLNLGRKNDVKAINTAYFAYKPGKLVKDVTVIEFNASMDNATLAALQQQMPGAGYAGAMGGASSGQTTPLTGGLSQSRAGLSAPSFGEPVTRGGISAPTPAAELSYSGSGQTAVKIRLVITKELVAKK